MPTVEKKVKRLLVPYDDAVALLKEAGVKTKWTRDKAQSYFDELPKKIPEEDVEDEDLKELYLDVKEALSKGGRVVVEEPQEVKPGPEIKEDAKEAKLKAAKKKVKKGADEGKGRKRPGICKMALLLAEKASEKTPMTKQKLYDQLLKKFPDYENPESMRSTADRFVYWAPYYFRLKLEKNAKGFWVTRDYEGEFQRIAAPPKKRRKKGK